LKYKSLVNEFSFSEVSKGVQSVLMMMPSKLDLIKPSAEILPRLAEVFTGRNIKIMLSTNIDPQSYEIIKKFGIIKPEAYDLDRFSLPKKKFIRQLDDDGIGVAIDMDTAPNFFNAVVAIRSGARVRAAFDKGVGLPYYNFILGIPSGETSPKIAYRAMADILSNFKK
jgi:hypothetical protein